MSRKPDVTLAEVFRNRARAASDGQLVLLAAIGIGVCVATVIWPPHRWLVVVCVAVATIAFAVYGIADRELATDHERSPRLQHLVGAIRSIAFVTSALAMFALFIASLPLLLGTWIS